MTVVLLSIYLFSLSSAEVWYLPWLFCLAWSLFCELPAFSSPFRFSLLFFSSLAYVTSSLCLSSLMSLHSALRRFLYLYFFQFLYSLYPPLLFLLLWLLSPGISASVRVIIYSLIPYICRILFISYLISLSCFRPGSPFSWFLPLCHLLSS